MSNKRSQGTSRPPSPLLRVDGVAQLLGCSTRHVRNMYREGRMPPRITVSERVLGWRESDIEEWLRSGREVCAAAGNCGACVLREICHRGAQRAPTNSSHGGQSDAQ